MAQALVAADLDLAADVGLDLAAEVALHPVARLDVTAQGDQLVLGEVLDTGVRIDPGGREGLARAGAADPEDVGQGDLDSLVTRQVDTGNTCHCSGSPHVLPEVVTRLSATCRTAPASENRGLRCRREPIAAEVDADVVATGEVTARGLCPDAACAAGWSR